MAGLLQDWAWGWIAAVLLALVVPGRAAGVTQRTIVEDWPGTTAPDCLTPCSARPQDQVWLVSTRQLADPSGKDLCNADWEIWCYQRHHGWTASSLSAFFDAEDPNQVTAFYVHGNRIDWETSLDRGWLAYQRLVCGAAEQTPMRFVIWSWPSSQIRGPLRDLHIKAVQTDTESYYLAWFLSRVGPGVPISLLGFSYGTRVVSGALHLLGGGEIAGRILPAGHERTRLPMRVVLLSAAMPNYWLSPGRRYDHALSQVDHLLLLYNSRDQALRFYWCLDPDSRPQALGCTGFVGPEYWNESDRRITQLDVSCFVGKKHSELAYFHSPHTNSAIRPFALWQAIDETW
jgi:hypothetical protein